MRILQLALCFGFSYAFAQIPQPANNLAFLQDEVASVYISIEQDSLDLLLGDSLYSGHEFMAVMTYEHSGGIIIYDSIVFPRARKPMLS